MAVGGGAVIEAERMDYVVDCKNKRLVGTRRIRVSRF